MRSCTKGFTRLRSGGGQIIPLLLVSGIAFEKNVLYLCKKSDMEWETIRVVINAVCYWVAYGAIILWGIAFGLGVQIDAVREWTKKK